MLGGNLLALNFYIREEENFSSVISDFTSRSKKKNAKWKEENKKAKEEKQVKFEKAQTLEKINIKPKTGSLKSWIKLINL